MIRKIFFGMFFACSVFCVHDNDLHEPVLKKSGVDQRNVKHEKFCSHEQSIIQKSIRSKVLSIDEWLEAAKCGSAKFIQDNLKYFTNHA